MKNLVLGRRRVLRGAGNVAVALPFLEIMRPRRAQAAAPRRFLTFFTGSGTIINQWRPTGSETDFTFANSPITRPLEKHRANLVVIDGMKARGANGEGHTEGMGASLTAMPLIPASGGTGFANGVSMDQVIGKAQDTPLKTIEVGVGSIPGTVWGRMSYSAPGKPIPTEGSPAKVFARLFTGFSGAPMDTGAVMTLREQRRTLIDSVVQDYRNVAARVGTGDRQRLDEHLNAIRELEKRMDRMPTAGTSTAAMCKPTEPENTSDYPKVGKLQMDLITMAFKCDRTRVATLLWEHAGQNKRFPFIGVDDEHHNAFHYGRFDNVTKIMTWFSQQFAYLLDQLQGTPDASGNLLDNTVVFWTSEQANGNNHSKDGMPYLLAGRCGGSIKTGRFLKYPGQPHPNLLVSLMNAMGFPVKTFGEPSWCTGPLPGLVA